MANKSTYKKGRVPWNKEKKLPGHGKPNPETLFKNYAIGTIRTRRDGYKEIKIANGHNTWRLLHREVWKREHGDYPPKNMSIVFIDGDRGNCDLDNLRLISKKEHLAKNSVHNLPEDIKEVIRLRGVLTRKINEKKQH